MALAVKNTEEGHLKFREGNFVAALEFYCAAINSATLPAHLIALHSNCAACYVKLRDHSKAVEACSSVLQLDPNHAGALLLRAQTLQAKRDYQAAILDVERLLQLKPSPAALNLEAKLKSQLAKELEVKAIRELAKEPPMSTPQTAGNLSRDASSLSLTPNLSSSNNAPSLISSLDDPSSVKDAGKPVPKVMSRIPTPYPNRLPTNQSSVLSGMQASTFSSSDAASPPPDSSSSPQFNPSPAQSSEASSTSSNSFDSVRSPTDASGAAPSVLLNAPSAELSSAVSSLSTAAALPSTLGSSSIGPFSHPSLDLRSSRLSKYSRLPVAPLPPVPSSPSPRDEATLPESSVVVPSGHFRAPPAVIPSTAVASEIFKPPTHEALPVSDVKSSLALDDVPLAAAVVTVEEEQASTSPPVHIEEASLVSTSEPLAPPNPESEEQSSEPVAEHVEVVPETPVPEKVPSPTAEPSIAPLMSVKPSGAVEPPPFSPAAVPAATFSSSVASSSSSSKALKRLEVIEALENLEALKALKPLPSQKAPLDVSDREKGEEIIKLKSQPVELKLFNGPLMTLKDARRDPPIIKMLQPKVPQKKMDYSKWDSLDVSDSDEEREPEPTYHYRIKQVNIQPITGK